MKKNHNFNQNNKHNVEKSKNTTKSKNIKKSNDDFKLFNTIEFGHLNYQNDNDIIFNNKTKIKPKKNDEPKKNMDTIDKKDESYKNINIKNHKKKSHKNKTDNKINNFINPNMQNEIIWHSNELNSDELELKFKNKFNSAHYNNINTDSKIKTNMNIETDINKNKHLVKFNENNHNNNSHDYNFYNNHNYDLKQMDDYDLKQMDDYDLKQMDDYDLKQMDDFDIEQMDDFNIKQMDDYDIEQMDYFYGNMKKSIHHTKHHEIKVVDDVDTIESKFVSNPEITFIRKIYRKTVDTKICVFECKKIDTNIFKIDIECDLNCSSHILFNNSFCVTHINNFIFMSNGNIYNPKIVEIYIDDKLIKRTHSDIMNNLKKLNSDIHELLNMYKITDSTYPMTSNINMTIKITDSNPIDNVYCRSYIEKIINNGPSINAYVNETIPINIISSTHELLYEGNESNITINTNYGYYQDIYIICEDITNNINTISLINTDVTLLHNIPIKLLEHTDNMFVYSLKLTENVVTGLKVDNINFITINLNKNKSSSIKVYGNKLLEIFKGSFRYNPGDVIY